MTLSQYSYSRILITFAISGYLPSILYKYPTTLISIIQNYDLAPDIVQPTRSKSTNIPSSHYIYSSTYLLISDTISSSLYIIFGPLTPISPINKKQRERWS